MGSVIRWPGPHHARTSVRAASRAKSSALTPASRTGSARSTDAHHSAGILSLCHHFETAEAPAPMAAAIASREGHSSMMERNDACFMDDHLRQSVLNGKAIMSGDCGEPPRQIVPMGKAQARSKFLADFLGRTKAAREAKFDSGREMAEALGWGDDAQATYSKYESRTPLPHYLISQFCKILGVRVDWLVTGEGPGPAWQPVLPEKKERKKPAKSRRAA